MLFNQQRGRPVTRWADDITQIGGKDWIKTAKDRDKWSSLEEAFTFTGGVLTET